VVTLFVNFNVNFRDPYLVISLSMLDWC